jgi:prepilin-type processing-associated H-X9-DG protein/prepilin-type N-terminal cleavage/methylation domain-containing protein
MKTRKSQRIQSPAGGFSLIELLIVMTIISILTAMLLPALRSARLMTRDIACGQNMRQIQIAINLYADDHAGLYPSSIVFNAQHHQLTVFSSYITKLDFYRCPLSGGDVKAFPAEFSATINGQTEWTEYKVNDHYRLRGHTLGCQPRPLRMVLVADAIDWLPRHRGKSNFCFFDGHVELLTMEAYNDFEFDAPPSYPAPGWPNWGMEPYN